MASQETEMTSFLFSRQLSLKRVVQLVVITGFLSSLLCPSTMADKPRGNKTPRRGARPRRRWKEGDIRLVGGPNRRAGTIFLYHNGKWGAVCDDMWNVSNSDVVCRQQGFPGSARLAVKKEFGGRAKRRIWITRVQCQGHEKRLLNCNYLGWGYQIRHKCPGDWRVAGVVCQPKQKKKKKKTAAQIRAWKLKQRLKVLARQHARTLARRKAAAAAVAAKKKKKKLKKKTTPKPITRVTNETPVKNRTKKKPVGQRRGAANSAEDGLDSAKDKVNLSTNNLPEDLNAKVDGRPTQQTNVLVPWAIVEGPMEQRDTKREPAHRRRTGHRPSTATSSAKRTTEPTLNRRGSTTTTTTTTTSPSTTTATSTSTTTSSTTTTTKPSTTTSSTTTTTTTTAIPTTTTTTPTTVTTPATTTTTPAATTTTATPTSQLPTTVSTSTATSTTENSDSARTSTKTASGNSETDTTTKMDSAVDLSKTKSSGEITVKDKDLRSEDAVLLQADSPSNPELELKLVSGRYKWEGMLEVREKLPEPGPWGTVCGDKWGMRETIVVCRQLGLNFAKQALRTNYFGGRMRTKIYYSFNCTGREAKLSDCPAIKMSQAFTCSKQRLVAGVVCSTFLPDLIPSLQALSDSVRLQDRPLYYLQCALEENCLSSSAYEIRNNSKSWRNNNRRLLRFSTIVYNRGVADFRPYVAKGQWQWHSCHMHYHSMEVFAHYDILDDSGTRLAEGSKASFCLEDTTCDRGVSRQFQCVGFGDQGLSVNCSDNYLWDIDCQWIDITDIKPGTYTFLLEVNPSMLIAELDFDNNVARCDLWYSGYFAKFTNCRHESLLDYRR